MFNFILSNLPSFSLTLTVTFPLTFARSLTVRSWSRAFPTWTTMRAIPRSRTIPAAVALRFDTMQRILQGANQNLATFVVCNLRLLDQWNSGNQCLYGAGVFTGRCIWYGSVNTKLTCCCKSRFRKFNIFQIYRAIAELLTVRLRVIISSNSISLSCGWRPWSGNEGGPTGFTWGPGQGPRGPPCGWKCEGGPCDDMFCGGPCGGPSGGPPCCGGPPPWLKNAGLTCGAGPWGGPCGGPPGPYWYTKWDI